MEQASDDWGQRIASRYNDANIFLASQSFLIPSPCMVTPVRPLLDILRLTLNPRACWPQGENDKAPDILKSLVKGYNIDTGWVCYMGDPTRDLPIPALQPLSPCRLPP